MRHKSKIKGLINLYILLKNRTMLNINLKYGNLTVAVRLFRKLKYRRLSIWKILRIATIVFVYGSECKLLMSSVNIRATMFVHYN